MIDVEESFNLGPDEMYRFKEYQNDRDELSWEWWSWYGDREGLEGPRGPHDQEPNGEWPEAWAPGCFHRARLERDDVVWRALERPEHRVADGCRTIGGRRR